jgi:hypothetical protein
MKYIHPSICSGIYVVFRQVNENEMIIEVKANNERDVLSIENIDCKHRMILDLEVSCSSLEKNIEIINLGVSKGEKKIR